MPKHDMAMLGKGKAKQYKVAQDRAWHIKGRERKGRAR
jgi:hypothetical protein